jgi:O-antigen ligase
MAKKKKQAPQAPAPVTGRAPGAGPAARLAAAEAPRGDWPALLVALALFLAPALGVPHEEMLQDTLKSIVVSFAALGAALLFFWRHRHSSAAVRWHGVLVLPLMLMAYALGSMAWSHTYLGGVEAIRWFVFSVILWLGLNTFTRERVSWLAWGIHGGAVVASLWAALQFWIDLRLFPQGPNPASTFVNRNFFAEFAACTIPFSALLLARARQSSHIALMAASSGFVLVAILMTGTRGALIAMWAQLLVVLPLTAWRYRRHPAFAAWDRSRLLLAAGVLLATVLGLGMLETGNARIAAEERGTSALERGFKRTGSISPNDHSLGVRMVMWKASATAIQAKPLTGLGAGAWESEIPRYQAAGSQLETDYYVHNEFIQVAAEYGLVGWAFLLGLLAYLSWAAWRTLRAATAAEQEEAPLRALTLCSLLALLIVSNIGFPWRMAVTGALFAVCLGILAASDARLGYTRRWAFRAVTWSPPLSRVGAGVTVFCMALATYITQQAAESERKIVRATKLALTISASGDYHNPRFNGPKTEMLRLIREGVAINPHYRKITPMVADELAKWGDWRNATWIWESVLSSRPYVVAIITNVARGHASTGQPGRALEYLARAKALQPDAPAVRSLEILLLARTAREPQALDLAREALDRGIVDYDLVNTAFALAWRARDFPLALRAMELRLQGWPEHRAAAYLQLGDMYTRGLNEPGKALEAFRNALEAAPPQQHQAMAGQIPREYWPQLGLVPGTPPNGTQTSASKG